MVVRAFTTIPINYWIPLTWVSYAVDYHFWGMNPTGYHLTNIIIHSMNAALVVMIAHRLFCWHPELLPWLPHSDRDNSRAHSLYLAILLLAGLLWAIHPARVESVAWATERKDVLNGLFLFASLYFYLQYAWLKTCRQGDRSLRPYLLSLLFFALSLMAKPSGVVLPLLLLLLDWFPGGRLRRGEIGRLLLEKFPYLALAGGVAAVTIIVGAAQGSYIPLSEFPLSARLAVIGNALSGYVTLLLNPAEIITYYHLPLAIPLSYVYKAAIAFVLLAACLFFGRRKHWFIAAILGFLIPLLPVLQLFPNGLQPALCTRYTYLPTLLPSILLALLIVICCRRLSAMMPKGGAVITGVLVLVLLFYYGMVTQRLIGDWKNSGTFWTRVIETQPFERAYFYRGLYYFDVADYNAAVQDYSAAIELQMAAGSQDIYNLYAFRGESLAKAGRYAEAVRDFDTAIAAFPHRLYYFHRAAALKSLGRLDEFTIDLAKAGQAKGQMHWFPPGSPLQ